MHALNLWLITKRRLKTQDNLRAWDNVVWHMVKVYAGLPNSNPSIDNIMNDIFPFAKRKISKSIIAKLVVAAWKKTKVVLELVNLWKLSDSMLQ
ncbi:hypothetical protein Tco_1129542 [Tanacetum coccineum]